MCLFEPKPQLRWYNVNTDQRSIHHRSVNLDNLMFNWSHFLLWRSVYSWIRCAWGTKEPSQRDGCWNSINRKPSSSEAVPPGVQHPPWGDRSLCRCLLCVSHTFCYSSERQSQTQKNTPPLQLQHTSTKWVSLLNLYRQMVWVHVSAHRGSCGRVKDRWTPVTRARFPGQHKHS